MKLKPPTCSVFACFTALLFAVSSLFADVEPALSAECDLFRLSIGKDARTVEFFDKTAHTNYCGSTPSVAFTLVKKGGKLFSATKAELTQGALTLDFPEASVGVTLKIAGEPQCVTVEVLAVAGEGVEECTFVHIPLALKGVSDGPFAACALALNLQANVRKLPGPTNLLEASCYPRFGFAGAKVALVGCPQQDLRRVMQAVVGSAPDLPHSPIGGPWAADAEINRGSYLFAPISEKTADAWIALAQSLGISQIDFDGMSRYGDAEPIPALYPNGRAGLKTVVDKVHAAGLKAGLHTYAFFVDKKCPWVTPVPDARLGKDRTFTLATALDVTNRTVTVVETTTNMSAITGFFVRNSATLQVDDELITYSAVDAAEPQAFAKCQRGAWGTRPAPHKAGAQVSHLKECFGRFTPDAESTLLAEVAARQAETVNACGFDMMYIDALDGDDILGGRENSWHYGPRFVFELWKRFDHPVLLEMSTMHHHLWTVRSRMGAWDHPTRSHKRFIDLHCAANASSSRMFLPMHLGWWAMKMGSGPQGEPTYSDDIEYLCCKAIGNNVGFSIMGVTPETYAKNPALQRLGGITRSYEALRHANVVPESVKARLRVPGDEFTLEYEAPDAWRFRPARVETYKIERLDETSASWSVTNTFARQPLRLRLELLISAEPYEATNAVTLASFADQSEFADTAHAKGVSANLTPSTELVKAGTTSARFTARNTRSERAATWTGFGKSYTTPLKLGGDRALGLWVHGDGQGEVLNFQLKCPPQVVAGLGEHYVVVDFTGWRYFELIEPEGERYADYSWPYGGPYSIYRERVDYNQIGQLTLWLNNLPARGGVTCYLSPVRALPLVKAKIQNPRVTVGDHPLLLPADMESGSYLELASSQDCKLYGPDGSLLQDIVFKDEVPALEAGVNHLRFDCDHAPNVNPRVRITVTTLGAPFTR